MVLKQDVSDISIRVTGLVRRRDVRCFKPVKCWKAPVVFDRCLKEVHYILVLAILWSIARDVESRKASCVLAEFVSPESRVVLLPGHPVVVHVLKEIVTTKGLEEGADVGSVVRWDESAVGQAVCRVGRWDGIVLTAQIAVLRVQA